MSGFSGAGSGPEAHPGVACKNAVMGIDESTPVMWGVQLPLQARSRNFAAPWEDAAELAELPPIVRALDEAGAGYAAVCDHVAIPAELVNVMGADWCEPIATLGWLAGMTTRLGLLSHVLIPAYRHPAAIAKAFTTLDALSGGRTILGVGAGHVQAEFELLGADFDNRGALLSDAIRSVREIFTTGLVDGMAVGPRSPRVGGPPIWVGGSSPAALQRAAMLGDGWLPQGPPKMGMSAALAFMAEAREAAHRTGPFHVGIITEPVRVGAVPTDMTLPEFALSGTVEAIAERFRRYRAKGFNQFQLRLVAANAADYADQCRSLGEQIWPLVEAA